MHGKGDKSLQQRIELVEILDAQLSFPPDTCQYLYSYSTFLSLLIADRYKLFITNFQRQTLISTGIMM